MDVGSKVSKFANAWHCRMAARSASKMLGREEIEKLTICGKRFELMKEMLKYVPKGIRRIADVKHVGPASAKKCKMLAKKWDKVVNARGDEGEQCKGIFFTSFGGKNIFRRCEEVAEAEGVCSLCKSMREASDKKGSGMVTVEGQQEYAINEKSLFRRQGVLKSIKFWDEESQKAKKEGILAKDYPYFSAQEIVSLLMVQAGVIFKDGGKGGRRYKRSEIVVKAQDEYLRKAMESCLIILKYENKKKFEKRFADMMVVAEKVHQQMLEANVGAEMAQVGAIQAPDIVRDELTRAARISEQEKKRTKMFSGHARRLAEWALAREKKGQEEMQRNLARDGSSDSVSSTSPVLRTSENKKSGPKTPLKLLRVETEDEQQVAQREGALIVDGTMAFKKFEIKESTISGAGRGLFLMEKAVHKEAIARYSGKLMSKEEAMASSSQYIVQVAKDKFLCAEGENEWEGKMANCSRMAQAVCNARFQANGRLNYCLLSKKFWIKIYAVGKIEPGDEVLPDYNREFWQGKDIPGAESLPTPTSNYKTEEEGESESGYEEEGKDGASSSNEAVRRSSRVLEQEKKKRQEQEEMRKRKEELEKQSEMRKRQEELEKQQEQQDSLEEEEEGNSQEESDDEEDPLGGGADEVDGMGDDQEDGKGRDDVSEDEEDDGVRVPVVVPRRTIVSGRRIYAVSVGRCMGMFRSVARMQSAVLRYPRGEHSKFSSEKDAEGFLIERGITNPRKYWKYQYSLGELSEAPESVVGLDVAFPVGLGVRASLGTVINSSFREDQYMWTVQMVHGQIDHVSEWPLLCGLQEAETVHQMRGRFDSGVDELSDEALTPIERYGLGHESSRRNGLGRRQSLSNSKRKNSRKKIIAIKGTGNDGIVNDVLTATRRLVGPRAEMKEFASRKEAEEWINEKSDEEEEEYFAIRGGSKDGVVTSMIEVFQRLTGDDAEYEMFQTREEAENWIEEWQFFAVRFKDGKCEVVRKADILDVTKGKRGIKIVGPVEI